MLHVDLEREGLAVERLGEGELCVPLDFMRTDEFAGKGVLFSAFV